MVFMSNKNGKPITVENLRTANLQENINKLIASILFNKTSLVKKGLIDKLNIKESQFETIIRKDASRISTLIFKGHHKDSLLAERYYFDKKYLFSVEAYFESNSDTLITIHYYTFIEENIAELSQLTIENKIENESDNSKN